MSPDVLTHSILPFIGILLLLLVVHEAGHYITAKLFGVKVLEAGIGLPPRIWGFRWRETDYTINAIPFGAFVRMLGEEDPSDPRSLAAQVKWKRTIIIGAGVVMNLALAIFLFTVSLMIPHRVSIAGAAISSVIPDSPAAQADLRDGDQILEVNGRKVENTSDASYLLKLYQGSNIDLLGKRVDAREGAQNITKSVYSRWDPGTYVDKCGVEQSQGPVGISIGPAHTQPISSTAADRALAQEQATKAYTSYQKQLPPGAPASCTDGGDFGFRALTAAQCSDLDPQSQAEAKALRDSVFPNSASPCYEYRAPAAYDIPSETRTEGPLTALRHGTRMSFESLILTRNQLWSLARGFGGSPITGPVGIAQATGEVVDQAGWQYLIQFAALISMSLALLNALPIPMVDGGRLLFIAIEALRGGRRVAPEKEALVHLIGFAAMIMLALVISFFDVMRIINGDSLLR